MTYYYNRLYWSLMNLGFQKIIAYPICLIFLIGMVFTGDSNILCISDTGHIKFETFCLPCCGEANLPDEQQYEPEESSNCSDIELDCPLWSKRIQNIDPDHSTNFISLFNTDAHLVLISMDSGNSQIARFHLAFGQSPPSYSMAMTVLRC